MKPQNFHFLRSQNHQIAKIAFFEVTAMKYEFLYSLYTRIGCDRISQRAAQGSLYRGAGRQRRSERLKVAPYVHGRWPCIFLQSVTAFSFPSPDCDAVGDGQRASRREACAYPDFITGDSLFIKTCHSTRIGCGEISLADFPREALTVRPWAVYFCDL